MQMLCMRSRLQPNTGSQRIPRIAQQLESEQKTVATMCVSIRELPTRLSTRYEVHKQRSTCCCPTHEMWELPTPLTVANSPSREMRDGSYPCASTSTLARSNQQAGYGYKRSGTTCNRCVYAVQHNAAGTNLWFVSAFLSNDQMLGGTTSFWEFSSCIVDWFCRWSCSCRCQLIQQMVCDDTTSWCKSNDDQLEGKSNVNQQLVATAHPVESFYEPAVAMNPVASFAYQVAVLEVSAVASIQRSRWKESMAEIKSCKLPHFKGTRFVLFWEIVQFTEEVCTEMERRQFGLNKRRTDLDSLSNGYIQTEAIYAKATPLKKVDECEKKTRRES
ncbi:TMV resistance protein N-like [Dorcoceras hygrometricum]|uniref:TMV resistance protein N-like n=1 Tax=Dorcoceras hygrometricum TaxID=472368 RepID=A0A2Z7CDB8_9LAMI|nr:TMV resistance protein N-like [Dorcoceras hygrometricum]